MNPTRLRQSLIHHEAVLVMESRGLALRSLAFSSAWSKLCQAGDYYLDMSVQPENQSARLQGQLLSGKGEGSPAGDIRLYFGDEVVKSATLGELGDFSLELGQAGEHRLVVELEEGAALGRAARYPLNL